MDIDNEQEQENENENEYTHEQTYALQQVPYEDHIVATGAPGLLSDLFDGFEDVIAKPVVGLTKEIGSDAVALGTEVAVMARQDVPDIAHLPDSSQMPAPDMSPAPNLPQMTVNDIHMESPCLAPAPEPAPVLAYEYDYSPDY